MGACILVIDQGTTGTTAAIFDLATLRLESAIKVEFEQIYPRPGWVEHNPEGIWRSVCDAVRQSLQAAASRGSTPEITVIGVTNQRETVVAWDRQSGRCYGNALVWQDRRTADRCAQIRADRDLAERIESATGLVIDPYFSATKAEWLLRADPELRRAAAAGEAAIGTVDAYIIYRLSGGRGPVVTDHTNASRTLLYDLRRGCWSEELADVFGVPLAALPEIRDSAGKFGESSALPGVPSGVPICGVLGDQQAALFGHGLLRPGEGKITYGTGAFLLVSTGSDIPDTRGGILATVAYSGGGRRTYALEGSAFIAGAALQFLRDQFGWIKNAAECEALALSEPRDDGIFFVPALAGLGAPFWNPNARATLFGLTRGSSRAQITRAVLESVALQNVEILREMERVGGIKISRLGVDGGAAANNYLMQFQADTAQVELLRPAHVQMTALGAARAAKLGLLPDVAPQSVEIEQKFTPQMSQAQAVAAVDAWGRAASCVDQFYRSPA